MVANLELAVVMFEVDNKTWPVARRGNSRDAPTDHILIDVLTGKDTDLNPNGTCYFEHRDAKPERGDRPPRDGLVTEANGSQRLVDSWGNLLVVKFDTDGDGFVDVPGHSKPIKRSVVCWSYGKPPDKSDHKSALDNPPYEWIKNWD